MTDESPWRLSWRTDPIARPIADRHYNRQSVGARDFVPPGRCLVLRAEGALWVTSWPFAEFVHHAWPGAWVNSLFRNERPDLHLSSTLIAAAAAATVWKWDPPAVPSIAGPVAMVTFIDRGKVRRKRDPGRCYLRAGFVPIGETKGGLLALGLPVDSVPAPVAPYDPALRLFA